MPRATKELTLNQIRALQDKKLKGKYADGKGLYLIVDNTGAGRWILRVTVKNMSTSGGKPKRMEIGLGGTSWVSIDEAREKSYQLRKIAKEGGNPLTALGDDIPSFEMMANEVFEQRKDTWKNEKHRQQWINTLKDYVYPEIGSMRVDHIGQADVLRCIHPIWKEKNETARRVMQRIATVLDVARASGYREGDNPVTLIKSANVLPVVSKGQKKHHVAMKWQEISEFWQELVNVDSMSALALRFTILTAARTSETINATWSEIDFETGLWTIPAQRMKASRDHTVPLSTGALDVLNPLKALKRDPFIFEGAKSGKPMSNMSMTMQMRRMNRGDVTVHGFRSSFRDWCGDNGVDRVLSELALAHSIGDATEQAYARSTMIEKRAVIMQNWCNFVSGEHSADVINLKV